MINLSYNLISINSWTRRMFVLCRILGHRRSARRATFNFDEQRWESVCIGCRKPMIRVGPRAWRLEPDYPEISSQSQPRHASR